MSLLLTVYDTPVWKTFVDFVGLPQIEKSTFAVKSDLTILSPIQSLSDITRCLFDLPNDQTLWLAVVQAEYFIMYQVEQGKTLTEAADIWKQHTHALLELHQQQRKKLKLFNLHQALAHPAKLPSLFNASHVKGFAEHTVSDTFVLLAACQYVVQNPELQAINTRLQASSASLCEDEKLVLDVDQLLHQSQSNIDLIQERGNELYLLQQQHIKVKNELNERTSELKTANQDRDIILSQLFKVQEELERNYLSLQAEQQNNKQTLLSLERQHAKRTAELESSLRKTSGRAVNAEYSGLLLQHELKRLRTSISWKMGKPLRILERILRKRISHQEKLFHDASLLLASEYFDAEWYLLHYPDVKESNMNPAEHYLLYGAAEGRLPSPLFDGNWYLRYYQDVAATRMNPLIHFILYGQQEGRMSSPNLANNLQTKE